MKSGLRCPKLERVRQLICPKFLPDFQWRPNYGYQPTKRPEREVPDFLDSTHGGIFNLTKFYTVVMYKIHNLKKQNTLENGYNVASD